MNINNKIIIALNILLNYLLITRSLVKYKVIPIGTKTTKPVIK